MPTKPSYSITKPKGVSQAIDNFVTVGKTEDSPKPAQRKTAPKRTQADDSTVQTTIRLPARLHQAARMLCLQKGTTLNELVVAHLETVVGHRLHVAKPEAD